MENYSTAEGSAERRFPASSSEFDEVTYLQCKILCTGGSLITTGDTRGCCPNVHDQTDSRSLVHLSSFCTG